MKKTLKCLLIAFMLSSVFLCQADQSPKEKPVSFYKNLLEQFCRRYYQDCFSRKYSYNSLYILDITHSSPNKIGDRVISWNMYVIGRHSFKGKVKQYNDDSFKAFIYDRGNNNYEVTFIVNKHYLLTDDKEMRATRTMTYAE